MTIDEWKKLPRPQQRKIAKSWDLHKGEGQNISIAVLRVFIERYGSNRDIEIDSEVIRLRDNAGWAISVQCFNRTGFKITPRSYMGIPVSRLHVDHIEDGVFFNWIPSKLRQSPSLKPPSSS